MNTKTIEHGEDTLPAEGTIKNDSQMIKRTRKTIGHYSIGIVEINKFNIMPNNYKHSCY